MDLPPTSVRVLTLNLHCWQEEDAQGKLDRIADAIAAHAVDVVCLQEVGQHVDAPIVDHRHGMDIRADNAALAIVERLQRQHRVAMDWAWGFSHIGFDVWEEGVAVLSRHPLRDVEVAFVSSGHSPVPVDARCVVIASVEPDPGVPLTVVSAHLSWWDHPHEPFAAQWQRTQAVLQYRPDPLLLAGDLNVRDDGPGYPLMLQGDAWRDAHALAVAPEAPRGTFPGDIAGWAGGPAGRIDYVLLRGAGLDPTASEVLFDSAGDRVSDHFGVLVTIDATAR